MSGRKKFLIVTGPRKWGYAHHAGPPAPGKHQRLVRERGENVGKISGFLDKKWVRGAQFE